MSAPAADAGSRSRSAGIGGRVAAVKRPSDVEFGGPQRAVTGGVAASPTRSLAAISYPARLALPLLSVLIAFPPIGTHVISTLTAGGWPGVGLAAVLIAMASVLLTRSAPAPGDADVHDRQLDVILAVPLFAIALWLLLTDPGSFASGTAVNGRQVFAAVCFAGGAAMLLWGTRLTARLRWLFLLALLALPIIAERPLVSVVLTILAVAACAIMAAGRLPERSGGRGRHSRVDPNRRRRARRGAGARQRLPALLPALITVTLLTAATAAVAMSATPPSSGPAVGSEVIDSGAGDGR